MMGQQFFITKVDIHHVRQIRDLEINLSKTERKHLILTGRNGSGKTSVLEALKGMIFGDPELMGKTAHDFIPFVSSDSGISLHYNLEDASSNSLPEIPFVVEYFKAKRQQEFLSSQGPKNLEGIRLAHPKISESGLFVQFLVNLWMERLVAKDDKDEASVTKIEHWFENFQGKLRDILNDPSMELQFDRKTWNFNIMEAGKEAYNLLQLSDGYSSILRIISQLIMRMNATGRWGFETQGIVLIDEIETHLHIELQKQVLPFLTSFFPNVQFIVSTHSPFVLSSLENAVIYDLEKRVVTEDLSAYSSELIVESFFDQDKYSTILKGQIAEFERLMKMENRSLEQEDRLVELESYLESAPKYLADELASKVLEIQLKYLKPTH